MPKGGISNSSPNEEPGATQASQHDPARFTDSEPAARAVEQEAAYSQQRHALIAAAAYSRAEQRGFAPGCELEDWLAAEAEIDAQLKPA